MKQYSPALVAYIDILGFKKMLEEEHTPEKMLRMLECIQTAFSGGLLSHLKGTTIQVSDGIIVAAQTRSLPDCFTFLTKIALAIGEVLLNDIAIRGAIAYGNHYFEGSALVSPAFTESYKLESSLATYPRVILHQSAVEHFKKAAEKIGAAIEADATLTQSTVVDTDGYRYLDYLKFYGVDVSDDGNSIGYEPNSERSLRYLNAHKEVIVSKLAQKFEPGIRAKYIWLGNYHNRYIEEERLFSHESGRLLIPREILTQYL